LLLAVVASIAFAQSDWTGEVLVQPASDKAGLSNASASRMLSLKGGTVKQRIAGPEIFVLAPPAGVSVADYMAKLQESGAYKVVAPNQYAMPAATCNDPELNNQWHLTQISAQVAWNYTTGSASKIVAIVDSGVDGTHPDLGPNLVSGYNSIQNLAESAGGVVTDVHSTGHGTRCMGIAVAKGNNGIGISGVGWNLKGMPIRVTNSSNGSSTISELLEGATWAVNNGANVVSVSYEQVNNPLVETTGSWMRTQGSLLVWAAGNTNTNLNNFDYWNVTIVGASDSDDRKLLTSSFGRAVDICAPGSLVRTTLKGGGYGNAPQGTSFATPQVAAAMALLMERFPSWLPAKVERQLLLTARDMGSEGYDTVYGNGRLNVGLAVWNPDPKWTLEEMGLPPGVNSATVERLNDLGDGVGKSDNDQNLIFYPKGGLPIVGAAPPGYSLIEIRGLNSSRTTVGVALGFGTTRGFTWNPSSGFTLHDVPNSLYTGINQVGDIVGHEGNVPFIIRGGVKSYILSSFLSGTYQGRAAIASAINDYGHISLTMANNGSDNAYLVNQFDGTISFNYANDSHRVNLIGLSETGYGAGLTNNATLGKVQAVQVRANLFDTVTPISAPLEFITPNSTWDSNTLARGVNNKGESVGGAEGGAIPFFADGIRYINPKFFVETELPGVFPELGQAWDITDKGDIVATRYLGLQLLPIILRRQRDLTYVMDLGQMGASPNYIGTIPPVVAVQFSDEAGVFSAQEPLIRAYDADQGRIFLDIPSSIGGSFRMRLQCNPLVTPGYDGCGYLSKIVPPLNEPAWPLDAFGQDPTTLYQGDCDLDNEIGPGDFEIVVGAFGSVAGEDDWNPQADADGDGEIGPSDFEIIVENFGLAGD
jgi:hypothetical protein